MKFWNFLLLTVIVGCIHKDSGNKNITKNEKNTDVVSIYGNAFSIKLPPNVKENPRQKILGDEIQYWSVFTNSDSTIKVNIEINRDTSRSFNGLGSNQIDVLKHFEPSMLVIKNEVLKQNGIEVLLVEYELPPVRTLPGYIVDRSIFFTSKGRATVDVISRFDNPKEKENCINLANNITESIRLGQ